jgi:hypothetical protein
MNSRNSTMKERPMRTTLNIHDDVLAAARDLAKRNHVNVGKAISTLARDGLRQEASEKAARNGVPQLPVQPGSGSVSLDAVNRLRDELL